MTSCCWNCCGLRFEGEVCPNCGGAVNNSISLGEGNTPLYRSCVWPKVWIKDERQNPTGTFKDRQAAMIIAKAQEEGIKDIVVASGGSTAVACAAYAAKAGIRLWSFLSRRHSAGSATRTAAYGGHVEVVLATVDETRARAREFARERGFFYAHGFDYAESMGAVADELVRDLGRVPDWYVQAVSGGLGPVGIVRRFEELGGDVPKLLIAQDIGCAPMAESFEAGLEEVRSVEVPTPYAAVLGTGNPAEAYRVIRAAVLEYGGAFVVVSGNEAEVAIGEAARREGIEMGPAAGVAFAALHKAFEDGIVTKAETVVINCSGR